MATSARLPLSFNQIIDLIKQLPKSQQIKIVSLIQEQEDCEVPEWHKKIVLDRVKNSKQEDYVDWKDFKKELKHKYDF
jgi:hypothetical protein